MLIGICAPLLWVNSLDADQDNRRRRNLRLEVMLKLADRNRLCHPNIAVWIWTNVNGLRRSNIDRIVVTRDKSSFSCLQFSFIPYTAYKLVACKMTLSNIHIQGSRHWKLKKTILACETYRNRTKGLAALKRKHLWPYLDGEHVWSLRVKFFLSQLISFRNLRS